VYKEQLAIKLTGDILRARMEVCVYIQDVPGGMDKTSGECSLS